MREGTAAYQAWVETPIPMYTKFYFFDMLNPRDLFHKHEKPILEERGPYTFRWGLSRGKMNLKFEALSDNGLKSTATRQNIFIFERAIVIYQFGTPCIISLILDR